MSTAIRVGMRGWSALLLVCVASGLGACDAGRAPTNEPLSKAELDAFESPLTVASWKEEGSWPQFAHDPLHTGRTEVDLGTADLEQAWRFRPSEYTYAYEPTYCAWSSPAVGTVAGRPLVFVGAYDHTLYAIDARTGEEAWHFTAGYPVFATPALGRVDGRPVVFTAPRDRTIYALDAANGERIWSVETQAWTFTAQQSEMSSPTVVEHDGKTLVYVGITNIDRSAAQNIQRGDLYCFDGSDGSVVWKTKMGDCSVASPAVARIGGKLTVIAAAEHGSVHALDGLTGEEMWTKPAMLDDFTFSSPSIGAPGGLPTVYIGTQFNALYAFDVRNGGKRWRFQTGNWIHSTPAMLGTHDDLRVVVGSYDFGFYALGAGDGETAWTRRSGNWAHTSAATARLNGRPVVAIGAWDDTLYLLSGSDGSELWTFRTGPLQWSHVQQGDALWASPAVARIDGVPHLIYPGYDGMVYAFRGRVDAESVAPAAAETAAAESVTAGS